jgi:hypothetical protein
LVLSFGVTLFRGSAKPTHGSGRVGAATTAFEITLRYRSLSQGVSGGRCHQPESKNLG